MAVCYIEYYELRQKSYRMDARIADIRGHSKCLDYFSSFLIYGLNRTSYGLAQLVLKFVYILITRVLLKNNAFFKKTMVAINDNRENLMIWSDKCCFFLSYSIDGVIDHLTITSLTNRTSDKYSRNSVSDSI
ncbi:Hypothetical protein CINCED_3A002430 [Cinara cedri]|uniref:Uncharacterized protein n=1 Tax=Cinara cedri TaxID=506608 RepID=A0A5E4N8C6_9HEMI|nr:Hypothetical protein CINCED_3A002430 [Cinara cedri]